MHLHHVIAGQQYSQQRHKIPDAQKKHPRRYRHSLYVKSQPPAQRFFHLIGVQTLIADDLQRRHADHENSQYYRLLSGLNLTHDAAMRPKRYSLQRPRHLHNLQPRHLGFEII